MFVNETGGERGLQFSKAGITVALPGPVMAVDLRIGAFAGSVTVRARNLAGNVVGTTVLPGTNRFSDVRIVGPEIASLDIADGGNEGLLAKICTTFAPCGCK